MLRHDDPEPDDVAEDIRRDIMPHYTSSIDAALSLVPDGFLWTLYSPSNNTKAQAQIETSDDMGNIIGDGLGATPAIALCIAALKARS